MRMRHAAVAVVAIVLASMVGAPASGSELAAPTTEQSLPGRDHRGERLVHVPLRQDPGLTTAVTHQERGAPFTATAQAGVSDEASVLSATGSASGPTVVGVTWTEGSGAPSTAVAVRTRVGDVWSDWQPVEVDAAGDGPGDGAVRDGTIPFLAGRVDEVQAAVRSGPSDVQLVIASPDATTAPVAEREPTAASRTGGVRAEAVSAVMPLAAARPAIHSRADWGADESLMTWTPELGEVRGAAIHHTAGTNSYTQADVPALIRGIYQYHAVSRGWGDIGYNFLVDKFGGIWEGRAGGMDRPIIGGHAIGVNAETTGVSFMGNYDTVAVPSAAISAAERVIAWKFSLHGVLAQAQANIGDAWRWPVFGHRDVAQTACPGQYLYSRLGEIRSAVIQLTGSGTVPITTPIVAGWYPVRRQLGAATAPPGGGLINGGSYQNFVGGKVHYSPASGAHGTRGGIAARWATLRREAGPLGYPTSDEYGGIKDGGAWQRFQGGYIHWSPTTGPHATRGAIGERWRALSSERGVLGYPNGEETGGLLRGGRYQRFEAGYIHWSPDTGAHSTHGGIGALWRQQSAERGPLGYPLSEENGGLVRGGAYQRFQRGLIHWSPGTGAHSTRGGIGAAWAAQRSENGALGYPTSEETAKAGGVYQLFEGGRIDYDARTGAVVVTLS